LEINRGTVLLGSLHPACQKWPIADGLVAQLKKTGEWGVELDPWQLGGGAAVDSVNQRHEEVGE
jgi:hypothetical protein